MYFPILSYAILGGMLPALLWLWFWRKEDRVRPEPRGMVLLAFLAGVAAVPLVLPIEKLINNIFGFSTVAVVLWAAAEELMKFGGAYITALRSRFMDEPIDAVLYLITTALGFSALENAFFLIKPIADGNFLQGFLTGHLRFIGATLLHTVSSAAIGGAMALSFYRYAKIRHKYLFVGILIAIALHALFNFLIIHTIEESLFLIFGFVWLTVVGLLLFFERIKRMKAINPMNALDDIKH